MDDAPAFTATPYAHRADDGAVTGRVLITVPSTTLLLTLEHVESIREILEMAAAQATEGALALRADPATADFSFLRPAGHA